MREWIEESPLSARRKGSRRRNQELSRSLRSCRTTRWKTTKNQTKTRTWLSLHLLRLARISGSSPIGNVLRTLNTDPRRGRRSTLLPTPSRPRPGRSRTISISIATTLPILLLLPTPIPLRTTRSTKLDLPSPPSLDASIQDPRPRPHTPDLPSLPLHPLDFLHLPNTLPLPLLKSTPPSTRSSNHLPSSPSAPNPPPALPPLPPAGSAVPVLTKQTPSKRSLSL